MFILFQIFLQFAEKVFTNNLLFAAWDTVFSVCSGNDNFVNKRTWDLLRNNIAKTLFHKTKAFIVINVRFENWQIPVETYPRIFSNFLKFIYYFIFIDFIRSTDAFRPIVRAQKYLMIYNRRYFKATARIGCMIPRSI